MTDESALFDLLYDQHASAECEEGRRPYLLVECLVTIQNSMIPEDDRWDYLLLTSTNFGQTQIRTTC